MEQESIIIAGCCRNVSTYLDVVFKNIMNIANLFADYHCIFVESNSNDDTLKRLRDFAADPKVEVITLGHMSETCRTKRLATCRNQILDHIRDPKLEKFAYLLMVDMDNIGAGLIDPEGIKSCFRYKNWSVMTASNPDFYYDIWALRWPGVIDYDCWKAVDKDDNRDKHVHSITKLAARDVDDIPYLVHSAFNGAALYKIADIHPSCRYDGWEGNGDICEHVPFHNCIRAHGGKIYINPRFVIEMVK